MNNIDHLDIDNNNNDNNNEVNEDNEVHIFNENTSRSCSTKSIFSSRTYSELISRDTINNNNKMITNFTAIDIDWYGNTSLHHAYALTNIDLKVINSLLDLHPEYAKSKNQFGRLPLHYALDRSTVNIKGTLHTIAYSVIDLFFSSSDVFTIIIIIIIIIIKIYVIFVMDFIFNSNFIIIIIFVTLISIVIIIIFIIVILIGIELLLQYYPTAVSSKDDKNITPYDLVLKWKHSSSIKRLLLDIEPDLDKITYLILKYGPIAKIYYCFYKPSYTCKYNDYDDEHHHHRGGDDDVVVRGNGHDEDDDDDNHKGNKFSSVIHWNKDRSNCNKILVTSKDQYDDNDGNNNHVNRNGNNSHDVDVTHNYTKSHSSSSKSHTNNENIIEINDDDYNDGHHDNGEVHGKHNRHYDITEVIAFNDDNNHIK
jgi:hypothetical protein